MTSKLMDQSQTVLKEKVIALNAYIKKIESSKTNNVIFHFRKL